MNLKDAAQVLINLQPRQRKIMYRSMNGTIVAATRTDKICPHDFAVGLEPQGRAEFYPTHVRLLFDLYLKRLSNENDAHQLFCALEKVYDGDDPEVLGFSSIEVEFSNEVRRS